MWEWTTYCLYRVISYVCIETVKDVLEEDFYWLWSQSINVPVGACTTHVHNINTIYRYTSYLHHSLHTSLHCIHSCWQYNNGKYLHFALQVVVYISYIYIAMVLHARKTLMVECVLLQHSESSQQVNDMSYVRVQQTTNLMMACMNWALL